ncbi:hypothetical protein D3C83_282470 [compost metagenome]
MKSHGLDLAFDEIAHRVAEFELLRSEAKIVHVRVPGCGQAGGGSLSAAGKARPVCGTRLKSMIGDE